MTGAPTDSGLPSRPGRSRKKTLLLVLGGLAGLIVVLLALAPTLAGSIAPGLIEKNAAKSMPGKVKVSGVKLGWGSSQVIGPVKLSDESGAEVADVTVRVSRGLFGLARAGLSGGGDFGTITILGKVNVVREKDGTTNLERALGIRQGTPAPGGGGSAPPGEPKNEAKFPPGLKAELALDAFEIAYTDRTPAVEEKVTAKNLSARVSVEAGKPLAFTMSGDAYRGAGGAGAPVGKINADAKIEGWSDASGRLTLRSARADVNAKIMALPVGLIDAFARSALPRDVAPKGLGDALGDSLDVVVTATGDAKDADVLIHAIFPRASASAALKVKDGLASAKDPIVVKAQGSAIRSLLPALDDALAKGQVTLDAIPDVQLAVDNLRVRLPKEGGALDLRGGGALVTLTLGPATGSVAVDRSPGATPRPFTLSGTQLKIDAPDFSGPARVTASGQAAVDGRAAGTLDADLTLAGLLDASGAPVKGMPGSISGKAALRGIQTAIAQPIVSKTPLDLPGDIGPTLDVELTASSAGGEGGQATTDINLTARSRQLSADGALRLDAGGLSTREAGVRASLSGLGSVARKFMPPDSPWVLTPTSATGDGMGEVLLTGLVVPLVDGTPQLDKTVGRAQVKLADFALAPKTGGSPVGLRTLALVAALGQGIGSGGAPHVEFDARGSHEGQEFNAAGTLDLPGLLAFTGGKLEVRPAAVHPAGRVDVTDLPTSLAGLVMAADPKTPGAIDMGRVARELLGPKLVLRLAASPAKEKDAADISVVTESQFSKVTLGAVMSREAITLGWMEGQVNVTPGAVDAVLMASEPDASKRPRLSGPAYLAWAVREPVRVPLDQTFKPDLARAGVLRARVAANGQLGAENLVAAKSPGGQDPARAASLKDFGADVEIPLSGLAPQSTPAPAKIAYSGTLLERGAPAGNLSGTAEFALAGGKPSGVLKVGAKLAQVRGTLIEALAGKPGLVTGSIGESLDAEASVTVSPQAGAAAGSALDFSKAAMEVGLGLAAPRLKTSGPMVFAAGEDRFTLRSPARLSFEAQPSWVNSLLAPEATGGRGASAPTPAMTLTQPTRIEIEIPALTVSRGAGPLKPGVFDVEFSAKADALALETSDKKLLSVSGVSARVKGTGALDVTLAIARAGIAGQAPGENLGLTAKILGLAGPNGEVSLETARLMAEGKLVSVPTALLDALAKQNGLLVEALGASCDATFSAMDVPLSPKNSTSRGLLTADFKSPRANAKLKGTVGEGVFQSDGPIEANLSEVTAALAAHFVKGLPFVGSVEKSRNDAPAMIVATGLSVPLAGDMSKLSGEIRITPGEAKFATSDVFGKLLELAKVQGGAAMVGRRLEPITITAKNGVITYPRYRLPLGEFTVETEGNVNLVDRSINVVTYVPAGALADETLGLFRAGGGLDKVLGKSPIKLDRMSMLPFRTKGSLDGAKTAPDLELFAKSFTDQLTPETIIEQGGDLLKDLLPKKKK